MNLSAVFIQRPVATTLLSMGVALAGALSYGLLSVAPLPQVEYPAISVQASLPGASPETMAATVATPLERALGTIAGVNEMTSSSSQGCLGPGGLKQQMISRTSAGSSSTTCRPRCSEAPWPCWQSTTTRLGWPW